MKFFKRFKHIVKSEVEEIKNLEITQEDIEQGEKLSILIVSGLNLCGIPVGLFGQKVIAKVCAYAIRDLKDGIQSPDNLILTRVFNEINKEE